VSCRGERLWVVQVSEQACVESDDDAEYHHCSAYLSSQSKSKTSFACDIVFPTYPRITSPRDIERLYAKLLKRRENESITEESADIRS